MILASLRHGRDGQLIVVSRDYTRYVKAHAIAPTLQAALDHWTALAPALQALAADLDEGRIGRPLYAAQLGAPLPRAYQWADGSAYVNHVELVRRARGAELPASFWTDPLIYQGGSDVLLAPTDPIPLQDTAHGLDCEAEVAVVLDDVPMGATPEIAAAAIRLVLLVNDVSLRGLIPDELAKGFGFFQAKPPTALSPFVVTPDELGAAWDGGRLHGTLTVDLNGQPLGRLDPGRDMVFDFPVLIAHAARTRPLTAGTVLGAGTVSNKGADGGPGRPVAEGGAGYACLAELRVVEQILGAEATTPFLKVGDRVRIGFQTKEGAQPFGTIEQEVVAA